MANDFGRECRTDGFSGSRSCSKLWIFGGRDNPPYFQGRTVSCCGRWRPTASRMLSLGCSATWTKSLLSGQMERMLSRPVTPEVAGSSLVASHPGPSSPAAAQARRPRAPPAPRPPAGDLRVRAGAAARRGPHAARPPGAAHRPQPDQTGGGEAAAVAEPAPAYRPRPLHAGGHRPQPRRPPGPADLRRPVQLGAATKTWLAATSRKSSPNKP